MRTERKLWHWILLYGGLVIIVHSLIQLWLLTYWTWTEPFNVWELLIAISASELVALLAGGITIAVSWGITRNFGNESASTITSTLTAEVRQSLSMTIPDLSTFHASLMELIDEVHKNDDALFIASIPADVLLACGSLGERLGELIRQDRLMLLCLPTPVWLTETQRKHPKSDIGQFWRDLVSVVSSAEFVERFADRRSIILPFRDGPICSGACVLRPDSEGTFKITAALAGISKGSNGSSRYVGAATRIDLIWGNAVLGELYAEVQEPTKTYGQAMISENDVARGQYVGLHTTRSIITSQFLIGCSAAISIAATAKGTRSVEASIPDGGRGQFEYSPEQFLPPSSKSDDHSGWLLSELFWNRNVSVEGKVILELGCGPGYVTTMLSKVCDGGKVIAVDISPRAIEVARANVTRNGNPSVVVFVEADALDLAFSVNASGSGTNVKASDGTEIANGIDLLLIDLPLVSYFGRRKLSVLEEPYLSAVVDGSKALLPAALRHVLSSIRDCVLVDGVEVILPVCASSDTELRDVLAEVGALTSGCLIEPVKREQAGFVHCILIRKS